MLRSHVVRERQLPQHTQHLQAPRPLPLCVLGVPTPLPTCHRCCCLCCCCMRCQVDLIAVDSVAALLPRAELEGDIGQAQVGVHVCLCAAIAACALLHSAQSTHLARLGLLGPGVLSIGAAARLHDSLQVASQARLMSAALRKLSGNAAKSGTTILFINQLRHKVGADGVRVCVCVCALRGTSPAAWCS